MLNSGIFYSAWSGFCSHYQLTNPGFPKLCAVRGDHGAYPERIFAKFYGSGANPDLMFYQASGPGADSDPDPDPNFYEHYTLISKIS